MNIKKLFLFILYKLSFPPFRSTIKKIYKRYNEDLIKLNKQLENEFYLVKQDGKRIRNPKIPGLTVEFYGSRSIIEIYEPYSFCDSVLRVGNNNVIRISSTKHLINNFQIPYVMREGAKIIIGENFSCVSCKIFMHDEPNRKVTIGNDCMFSFDVIIWPSDGHAIIDNKGNVLNRGEDIEIGDHVWLGMGVNVLKGSYIPSNSIVAARSLYLKTTRESSNILNIYAGIPAKIVKSGDFTWCRDNCYDYLTNKT